MSDTEELFDVYDRDGINTGRIATAAETTAERLIIKTAAVWFVKYDGGGQRRVLLQKNGKPADKSFGKWRLSVTGKTRAGESTLDAAQRETAEELGLDIPKKKFCFIKTFFYDDDRHLPYFCDMYVAFMDAEIADMKIDETEVADVRWFDLDYLIDWEQNDLDVDKSRFGHRLNCLLEWLGKNGNKN